MELLISCRFISEENSGFVKALCWSDTRGRPIQNDWVPVELLCKTLLCDVFTDKRSRSIKKIKYFSSGRFPDPVSFKSAKIHKPNSF